MELNEFRPPLLSVSSSMFSPFWTDFSGKEETGAFSVGTGVLEEEAKFRGRLATETVVFHCKTKMSSSALRIFCGIRAVKRKKKFKRGLRHSCRFLAGTADQ